MATDESEWPARIPLGPRSHPAPTIEVALFDLAEIALRRRLRGYELMSLNDKYQ